MSGYLNVLLSEPLSYSLMLLLLALLCAYFARPSWRRGIAIAVCLNLLILARPASVSFAAVIVGVWVFHWGREGLGVACRRAGGLALLFVGGILLHCTYNLVQHGHFRQHAFTGMNLMTTALQVADADDAKVFDDSKLARYAQLTICGALANRQTPFNAGAADANCWQFAVPAYATVYGSTAEEEPFVADDVLTRVARAIIRRHPRQFMPARNLKFLERVLADLDSRSAAVDVRGWVLVVLAIRRLAVLICCVSGRPAVRRHHPRVPDELPDRPLSVAHELCRDLEPALLIGSIVTRPIKRAVVRDVTPEHETNGEVSVSLAA